jgi:DNA-binding transcriptional MerR regulator
MPQRLTPIADDDPLLLIEEAAELTRRSPATLRWLRHRGEGPPAHRAGRRIYYRRSAVIQWLKDQEQLGADPRPAA